MKSKFKEEAKWKKPIFTVTLRGAITETYI